MTETPTRHDWGRIYWLHAEHRGLKRVWVFRSLDDRLAVADGAFEVLRQSAYLGAAHPSVTQQVWALGMIRLINDMDVVLAEMQAKDIVPAERV